jgi:hypothetical protein
VAKEKLSDRIRNITEEMKKSLTRFEDVTKDRLAKERLASKNLADANDQEARQKQFSQLQSQIKDLS